MGTAALAGEQVPVAFEDVTGVPARRPSGAATKIFDIVTPKRMAWVALGAAVGYAVAGFAVGGEAMWLVILGAPPLLLLSGLLWLPAAWAGAVLGLVTALLGFGIGPLAGGILALIGLAALLSELPHLRHPNATGAGR